MGVWDKKNPWSFVLLLLPGALGQSVTYPGPMCAVKGSTVTIPCTFTHLQAAEGPNKKLVPLKVVRVIWCQDHLICQGTTPSVYDSKSRTNNKRYRYLGDLSSNCTLQINNIQLTDSRIHRFRIEMTERTASFTDQRGVNVTVIGKMRISSSSGESAVREGGEVTLNCTATCSFHQLNVTWYKNDHALLETGHTLQLNPLTVADSGNYSCALKTNLKTRSNLYSLAVEADEETNPLPLIVGIVVGVLLAVLVLMLLLLIKRKQVKTPNKEQRDNVLVQKPLDTVYSSVLEPGGQQEVQGGQETSRAAEEVSYSTVIFQQNPSSRLADKRQHQAGDAVVYASVSRKQRLAKASRSPSHFCYRQKKNGSAENLKAPK